MGFFIDGAGTRSRTGTAVKPRDFKSLVSTNFTIPANTRRTLPYQASRLNKRCESGKKKPKRDDPLGFLIHDKVEASAGVEPAYMDLQSSP